ncbi:MAG: mechanosensitive ion channel family protein [Myxococcales bacterium]|nr:mechanosensitive ion channel family protein [Myxococcales bacterium]
MTELLQSNLALAGAILAAALIGVRAASRDAILRRDLGGAIYFLVASVVLRAAHYFLAAPLPLAVQKGLQVSWMLALAFGAIRAGVSASLWAYRRFRRRPLPKILRDVIDFSLYLLAAVSILRSELAIDLTGLLATSAILSVVLGLALQDTLGNLFAGLSLQLGRPFQVGDFVTVGDHTGRIVQLAWRATRIETFRREVVTLPNNVVAKQAVVSFSAGSDPIGVDLHVGVSYRAAPDLVRSVILEVLRAIPRVLADPPPTCRVWSYDDSAVRYQVRFWLADYAESERARGELLSRLWYRFSREGIEIPFPQRTLHLVSPASGEDSAARRELVRSVGLFSALSEKERDRLAGDLCPRRFGDGERIIAEGAEGDTFYLVAHGEVSVRLGQTEAEVARLGRGHHFGEMSLLTGEQRSATVVALGDAVLYELDRPAFARLFEQNPGLARALSALLAERRGQLKAAAEASGGPQDVAPEAGRIFDRLKQIFGLRAD